MSEYRAHPANGLLIGDDGTVIGRRGKPLKPSTTTGYAMVAVCTNGVVKHELVHRLVAATFVGGSGPQVNHKDGNKLNNAASNLEWCDAGHNNRHALATGLRDMRKARRAAQDGAKNPRARLTIEQVAEIRRMTYGYGDAPWKKYGIGSTTFYNVRHGRTWKEAP